MMNKKLFALLVAIATVSASTFAFLGDLVEDAGSAPAAVFSSDAREARRERIDQRNADRAQRREERRQRNSDYNKKYNNNRENYENRYYTSME